MKQSFNDYKMTIDNNLSDNLLYSGDVKSSIVMENFSELKHSNISPIFIIDTIEKIYNDSVKLMFDRAEEKEYVLDFNKFDSNGEWLEKLLIPCGVDIDYILIGDLSKLGITKANVNKPFPSHFYHIRSFFMNSHLDKARLYKCPLIKKLDNEIIVYVSDRPIQSLVYSIQNMSYTINGNRHKIEYEFYECDYISYKIVIKDVSKMREEKIKSILN